MRVRREEEAVLLAAEEVFLQKGLEGARTAEIAQMAGVTHAVLHYWFKTNYGEICAHFLCRR